MSHKSKESLFYQAYNILHAKFRPGESKYEAKKDGTASNYIYSIVTLKNYLDVAKQFTKFCRKQYHCKNLAECRPHVDDYLRYRADCSAWTVKKDASALGKLFDCSTKEFIKTGSRHRAEIKRSRVPAVRDGHFSETRNADLVTFCRSTGLRRSEVAAVRGTDYEIHNGIMYIHVKKGKGGKERYAMVIGDKDAVMRMMDNAGDQKVFPSVHSAADIHGYRAEYAAALYLKYARPIEEVPKKERYHCQGELNCEYDRKAMLVVSRSLGHNRVSVIAQSYLYRVSTDCNCARQ